jgi:protein-tyrosine-phosphatase
MAEAMARRIFKDKDIEILSAGIACPNGAPASENAALVMKERGLDISGHRSRPVDAGLAQWADVILTMGESHKTRLESVFSLHNDKILTLAEYAFGENRDISDPFFYGLDVYKRCAGEIYDAILKIAKRL